MKDFADLRHRFDEFSARFAERSRGRPGPPGGPGSPPLSENYLENVQDLFTRDVTAQDFRDLIGYDTPDAFRFFSREIDFEALEPKPWYKRYPIAGWKVFLAMAFRLSPARRVLFALAVPLLAFAWTRVIFAHLGWSPWRVPSGYDLVLLAATLLFALLVMELRDKLALKGDLEIARQIQFGLLPFAPFERNGTAIYAAMRPANTVGGDYFDIIELGGGRIAVAIGDVAGKGIPAALLMALLQGSLRTLLNAGFRGAELIAKLNDYLHLNIPRNRLVTLFFAEYDPASGHFEYINAGHNAPVLLHGAAIERLPATGMALGVMAGQTFEARGADVRPGGRLFLFTDGISEAFDPEEKEYGEERLLTYLVLHSDLGHPELIDGVRADVLAFCGPARPRDDMTMLVLGRAADGAPAESPAS